MRAVVNARCVAVQMRIVVAKCSGIIKLVNCVASRLAQEEFSDNAIDYCMNRRAARFDDVNRLMASRTPWLIKSIVELVSGPARASQISKRERAFSSRLALSSKYKEGQFPAAASWMSLGRARPFLCSVKISRCMVNRCLTKMLPSGVLPQAASTI